MFGRRLVINYNDYIVVIENCKFSGRWRLGELWFDARQGKN
jgi:hypothetical protein